MESKSVTRLVAVRDGLSSCSSVWTNHKRASKPERFTAVFSQTRRLWTASAWNVHKISCVIHHLQGLLSARVASVIQTEPISEAGFFGVPCTTRNCDLATRVSFDGCRAFSAALAQLATPPGRHRVSASSHIRANRAPNCACNTDPLDYLSNCIHFSSAKRSAFPARHRSQRFSTHRRTPTAVYHTKKSRTVQDSTFGMFGA